LTDANDTFRIAAKATYKKGDIPKTSSGFPYGDETDFKGIAAGSVTGSSVSIVGRRCMFGGSVLNSDIASTGITAPTVRGLERAFVGNASGKAIASAQTVSYTLKKGHDRFIFAIPRWYAVVESATYGTANQNLTLDKYLMNIPGKSTGTEIPYLLYTVKMSNTYTTDTKVSHNLKPPTAANLSENIPEYKKEETTIPDEDNPTPDLDYTNKNTYTKYPLYYGCFNKKVAITAANIRTYLDNSASNTDPKSMEKVKYNSSTHDRVVFAVPYWVSITKVSCDSGMNISINDFAQYKISNFPGNGNVDATTYRLYVSVYPPNINGEVWAEGITFGTPTTAPALGGEYTGQKDNITVPEPEPDTPSTPSTPTGTGIIYCGSMMKTVDVSKVENITNTDYFTAISFVPGVSSVTIDDVPYKKGDNRYAIAYPDDWFSDFDVSDYGVSAEGSSIRSRFKEQADVTIDDVVYKVYTKDAGMASSKETKFKVTLTK
jgi:hypothetical protein